jgi:hypothetical protein
MIVRRYRLRFRVELQWEGIWVNIEVNKRNLRKKDPYSHFWTLLC